jgi:hypothetical protein
MRASMRLLATPCNSFTLQWWATCDEEGQPLAWPVVVAQQLGGIVGMDGAAATAHVRPGHGAFPRPVRGRLDPGRGGSPRGWRRDHRLPWHLARHGHPALLVQQATRPLRRCVTAMTCACRGGGGVGEGGGVGGRFRASLLLLSLDDIAAGIAG